eukprot:CAMPEP_0172361830 /NCGR_PEP_ID=MMETSP1060-20121228/5602_1 /TAXON_ID=37318 /ORGANISM="Pseudo-nitzschia pungens, Strain cf. cingulata" /LENGTH=986 /DNA_ID=CAMNT_0013084211 /DNA_START=98 /DNA_END=3058 /DNA_ORIENTATION=-
MARGVEDNDAVSTHAVGESSRLLPANKRGVVPRKTKTKTATQKRKNSDGSLDFERVVNEYSIEAKRELLLGTSNKGARIYSKNTIRWVLTIACALFSGFTTVVIVSVTEELVSWRTRTLANWLTLSNNNSNNEEEEGTYTFWFVFGAYCLVSLLLADAAAALCLYWPGIPEAVGSGIPEVKAYLNGIRVKKFDNLVFVIVKMVGSVLSVGSSMAVGMEGPLVMIGACAGATLAHCGTILSWLVLEIKKWKDHWKRDKGGRFRPTTSTTTTTSVYDQSIDPESEPILYWLWVKATSDLSYFANDAERRKLITVGAACGFAASFGAPIGGMLFIMDDISTFFDQGMFLRILVANSVGTFCLAYYRGNLTDYGAITFGSYTGDNDNSIGHRFVEIPFWIAMGIGGGVLGGWFCKAFGELKKKSGKQFQTRGMKLLRVSYISLINSVVMFLLPTMPWVCHEETAAVANAAAAAEQHFFCEKGQVNQMATIFFGSRAKAIVRILSEPGQFFASTLAIVGAVFFLLMLVTNTTSIPSGLFTPIVVSGASFGAAFGVFLNQYVDENIDASSFALLGVGAMMAGIQRSTVSTCVILVEGTGQMKILLPAMIVVVISNYVAHMVHNDGVYEVLMKLKGYPYLCHATDDSFDVVTVRQIMTSPPVTVREQERAVRLVEILRSTSHHGFPVVDKDGHFQGLVRRKQIIALMEFGVFQKVGPGDDAIERSISDSAKSASDKLGNSNRGPMKYAYVAKDGLYNIANVEEVEEEEAKSPGSMWRLVSSAVKMKMVLTENKKRRLADDITMPIVDISKLVPSNFVEHEHEYEDAGIDGGGEDVVESDDEEDDDEQDDQPAELRIEDIANADQNSESSESDAIAETVVSPSSHQQGSTTLQGFARVGLNPRTNVVVISWLNPDCKDDVLDLAAVMNRGAYSVPEDFPLSKAYNLFTLLGLRWIVVVGGADGGTVVGLLTRESFLELNLKEKTGKYATYFERV